MIRNILRFLGFSANVIAQLSVVLAASDPKPGLATDNTKYCNVLQNKSAFIRYPLGTLGIWSTPLGEMADVMTRIPRIYPCVNSVVVKPEKEEWRDSIVGDPAMLSIKYRADKPSDATTVGITVTPHLAVFQETFPHDSKGNFLVFDFSTGNARPWAALDQWTTRTVRRIDGQTLEATIGEPGHTRVSFT